MTAVEVGTVSCPSWCTTPDGCMWDTEVGSGRAVRFHQGHPDGGDRLVSVVGVEYADQPGVVVLGIELVAEDIVEALTAEEATGLANSLLAAAAWTTSH